ncbi:hypothetical protein LJC25_01790 [Bacteroidales bacterium OttesenSCG-928-K03]|nr:hypothetical protein [Odoribacter sp. OttesenSCG-928-L07]MDL2242440.1 hypothetical protein [Bacteroidales bacterium OttesenSCG-928-K03]
MKKMFLLILITVMCVGLNYANTSSIPVVNDEVESEALSLAQEKRPKLRLRIYWGRWINGDCVPGFGICEIRLSVTFGKNSKGNDDGMFGEIENTGKELVLFLEESDIKGDDILSKNISSSKSGIKFDQAFTIPAEVMMELGIRGEKKVSAGSYKVSFENGKVKIHIPL